jgi:hypothetical protein
MPGCLFRNEITNLNNITELRVELGAGCSHGRAPRYFFESINSKCRFRALECKSVYITEFVKDKCIPCDSNTTRNCPIMGYYADQNKVDGNFYLETLPESPFCKE